MVKRTQHQPRLLNKTLLYECLMASKPCFDWVATRVCLAEFVECVWSRPKALRRGKNCSHLHKVRRTFHVPSLLDISRNGCFSFTIDSAHEKVDV